MGDIFITNLEFFTFRVKKSFLLQRDATKKAISLYVVQYVKNFIQQKDLVLQYNDYFIKKSFLTRV